MEEVSGTTNQDDQARENQLLELEEAEDSICGGRTRVHRSNRSLACLFQSQELRVGSASLGRQRKAREVK